MLKVVLLQVLVAFALVANGSLLDLGIVDSLLSFLDISKNPDDIQFYLFPNPDNFSDFDILEHQNLDSIRNSRFSADKKVVILTHGFYQNVSSDFPQVLIRDYLNAGFGNTTNIIAVDWGQLSGAADPVHPIFLVGTLENLPQYKLAVDNVPVVGKRIQEFIVFLQNNSKISGPSQVHLVGQSLGSHISGYTGMYYQKVMNAKLDRITGTDPAAPLFQNAPTSNRLDSTDAEFVDTVHANQGEFGYVGDLGHVDFYVNKGGPIQPGCETITQLATNTFCSHNTAPHYYGKSIANSNLVAYNGSLLLNNRKSTTFGEFVPRNARGSYYIKMVLPTDEIPPP